jgi:NAD(P)-dependent dehydrogenase (short-subunit alcohol dehydrogenase family)/Ran GTPase-activating protein (RanGAP) involved in mRNA processing and transport
MPRSPATLAPPTELEPLLAALRAGRPVQAPTYYPRGCLLPDGRLDLCRQDLGPLNARAVAKAMAATSFVESLLLGADHLGDDGARAIADLLESGTSLSTVFVGCNLIGPQGAEALAGAAERPGLRGLWLKRNAIGERGARAVVRLVARSQSLRTLDLVDTGLEALSLAWLAQAVAHSASIERLYVGTNGLDDVEPLSELLAADSGLVALFAGSQPLGDRGAAQLAAGLERNRRLRVLELPSAAIGPAGVQALARAALVHGRLERLSLGGAPAAGLLRLRPNVLGDTGVRALAELVAGSTTLLSLDVGGMVLPVEGQIVLLDALEASATVRALRVDGLAEALRPRLPALLARNRGVGLQEHPDVRAIRSVYRTRRGTKARASSAGLGAASRVGRGAGVPASAPERPVSASTASEAATALPTAAELAAAVAVLERLAAAPHAFFERPAALGPVRAAANRVVSRIIEASRARKEARTSARAVGRDPSAVRAHDRALLERTGLRQQRSHTTAPPPSPTDRLLEPRSCYVCKAPYTTLHTFYDGLCPRCGEEHFARRSAASDLDGRTALLTGGRLKIGRHVALKLLRAGARVIITTRFPRDAARRFAAEPDFTTWQGRLEIVGIDLRHLPSVEALAAELAARDGGLDILINNAAQTIRRPPEFYAHLAARETEALASGLDALIVSRAPLALEPTASLARGELFPPGLFEDDGQQLDRRATNSWSLPVGEVSTLELLEVQVVNSLAPFILVRGLLPAFERSAHARRFIVNVSAMEGSFSRAYKSEAHPHTNMAKAALNMLTRTSASGLARRGVYMNSVDTGWITNEQPHPIRERMKTEYGFSPPLDELDGAARICDPIFRGVTGDVPMSGLFLKDYRAVPW